MDPRGTRWRVQVPTHRRERIRGLRGRDEIGRREAFLIRGATSIHTFGMRVPLTVAWLDDDLTVVEIGHLGPRRVTLPRRRARHVLECAEGSDLRVGDRLVTLDP
ncbi:MAG: DUF192 domain-containing protein [Actinomycetota bacterium]